MPAPQFSNESVNPRIRAGWRFKWFHKMFWRTPGWRLLTFTDFTYALKSCSAVTGNHAKGQSNYRKKWIAVLPNGNITYWLIRLIAPLRVTEKHNTFLHKHMNIYLSFRYTFLNLRWCLDKSEDYVSNYGFVTGNLNGRGEYCHLYIKVSTLRCWKKVANTFLKNFTDLTSWSVLIEN
jgi:hypothetical protein